MQIFAIRLEFKLLRIACTFLIFIGIQTKGLWGINIYYIANGDFYVYMPT